MTLPPNAASAEWQLLLACAAPQADAARIREQLRARLDWAALLSLADTHGVIPLFAKRILEATEEGIPSDARHLLGEMQRRQALFTLALNAELFRLSGRFVAAGIETAVMKGPVLAVQAFGDPSLRQFADLDLLLRHRDIFRAADILRTAGFESKVSLEAAAAGRVPGQFLFVRVSTRTIVELHTERTLRYFPRALPLEGLLARRVSVPFDGHEIAALSPADSLPMICVHASKHLWQRLMWIADVAALVTRQQSLGSFDWPRALATAKETGAGRMVRLGLRLAMDVFAAPVPKDVAAAVRGDAVAARLAAALLRQLPAGENVASGVAGRAAFRIRMCGGWLRGPAYLVRLAFAPTEEDWGNAAAASGLPWFAALRRPVRLARKYAAPTEKTKKAQL